jgi:hypothetical protein
MLQRSLEDLLCRRDRALALGIHEQEFLPGGRFHQDNVTACALRLLE